LSKVILSNGIEFDCLPSQTILEAAIKNKIAIEHSCKTGRCGICIAQVEKGQSLPLHSEESISLSDFKDGKILTCCRTIESDVYLDIHDLGEIGNLPILTSPCRIFNMEFLNNDVLLVTLRLPPSLKFKFVPGQYIELIHEGIRRSYSIANAPREDGNIQLIIKKVSNGLMSDYLFNRAKSNDLLRMEGPQGTFSLRENGSKNIIFIATGTGIAPIKSILEKLGREKIQDKIVYIFWGGRYKDDIFYDFSKINVAHHFIPVLSRDEVETFFKGYVQDAVLSRRINLLESTVYACGSEAMIAASAKLLIRHGLKSKQFFSDAFISSN
jgi:CDP-4-dehydro-6-deoxyglucose reductase